MQALRTFLMSPPLTYPSRVHTSTGLEVPPERSGGGEAEAAGAAEDGSNGRANLKLIHGDRVLAEADSTLTPPPPPPSSYSSSSSSSSSSPPSSKPSSKPFDLPTSLKNDLTWSTAGGRRAEVDVYYKACMQARLYEVEIRMRGREQAGGGGGCEKEKEKEMEKITVAETDRAASQAFNICAGNFPIIVRQPSPTITLTSSPTATCAGCLEISVAYGCFSTDRALETTVAWEKYAPGSSLIDDEPAALLPSSSVRTERRYWWGFVSTVAVPLVAEGGVGGKYVAVVSASRKKGGKVTTQSIRSRPCEVTVTPHFTRRITEAQIYCLAAVLFSIVEAVRFTGVSDTAVKAAETLVITGVVSLGGWKVLNRDKGEEKVREKGEAGGKQERRRRRQKERAKCECCEEEKGTKKQAPPMFCAECA